MFTAVGAPALLLLGATVGLHLERNVEFPLESALSLANAFGSAIEARSKKPPSLDDPVWSSCPERQRCLAEIAARTKSDDIVLMRMFGGPTRIKLIAERVRANEGRMDPVGKVDLVLERDATDWPEKLKNAALRLFPEGAPSEARVHTIPARLLAPDTPPGPPRVYSWISAGGTAVLGGLALGFGLVAAQAKHQLDTQIVLEPEAGSVDSRRATFGVVSNVLIGATCAAAALTALLFIDGD
jgi:hypothetical protein